VCGNPSEGLGHSQPCGHQRRAGRARPSSSASSGRRRQHRDHRRPRLSQRRQREPVHPAVRDRRSLQFPKTDRRETRGTIRARRSGVS
jgi:hypothetical protein